MQSSYWKLLFIKVALHKTLPNSVIDILTQEGHYSSAMCLERFDCILQLHHQRLLIFSHWTFKSLTLVNSFNVSAAFCLVPSNVVVPTETGSTCKHRTQVYEPTHCLADIFTIYWNSYDITRFWPIHSCSYSESDREQDNSPNQFSVFWQK